MEAALRLAKRGHTVNAGVYSLEQVESLNSLADQEGISLNVLVMDITKHSDG